MIEQDRKDLLGGILRSLPAVSQPGLVPDLLMLFDHLEQSGDDYHAANLAEQICRLGNRDDFEALLRRRAGLSPLDAQRRLLLALCQCRIRHHMQGLELKQAGPVVEAGRNVELPEHLAGADAELQAAYRRYQALKSQFEEEFSSLAPNNGPLPNWKLFTRAVEGLLLQEPGAHWRDVVPFHWDAISSMRGLVFDELKQSAMLVSLLDARDYDLALTVMMQTLPIRSVSGRKPVEWLQWLQRLSKATGRDATQLLWGGVLSDRTYFLDYLSHGGSQGFAAELLKAAPVVDRMPQDWIRQQFIRAAADYIRPGLAIERNGQSGGSVLRDWPSPTREFASDAVQTGLLEWMGGWTAEADDASMLEAGTRALSLLLRRESIPALKHAFASPYSKIREMARSALRKMGEEGLDLPLLEDFQFRLIVDGRPLKGGQVNYAVARTGGQIGPDEQGVLKLDHDQLTLLETSADIVFRATPIASPDEPWFMIRTAVPRSPEIQDLEVETTALRLHIAERPETAEQTGGDLRVQLSQEEDGVYHAVIDGNSALEDDLLFRLTPGLYRGLKVHFPGSALWELDRLEVPAAGAEVEIALQPGADVSFSIKGPKRPASLSRGFNYQLERKGAVLGWFWVAEQEPRLHEGLPAGVYRLRVLSSREERERFAREGIREGDPEFRHKGKEIRFEIRPDGPAVIDLGVIELVQESSSKLH